MSGEMMETETIPKIICATGHRPHKLGGYSEQVTKKLTKIAKEFIQEENPSEIVSGMALGWDMAWAEAGLELGIPVIAAVPFFGQECRWPKDSRDRYARILSLCYDVFYICDQGYAPWKMQIRNEWMVDHSDIVAALWDGSDGGTANCIQYATKENKQIINLWEKFQ